MFFFFKQKTAYEMRISDWSSDVCSSDLWAAASRQGSILGAKTCGATSRNCAGNRRRRSTITHVASPMPAEAGRSTRAIISRGLRRSRPPSPTGRRSEEHTSELQSLMRISYAVFCLKKKKNHLTHAAITARSYTTHDTISDNIR